MRISAIICTRNRAAYLPQAIGSLAGQDIPANDYEIIVIDNGSTDDTKAVVRGLIAGIPNLRYVIESNPGLSNARNRGLKEAAAPIVAFLDDDAIAANDWLSSILGAFNVEPHPACVGGPVKPWWETPRPRWFPDSMIGCHNRDYGNTARWYNYPAEHPIGCNMAFLKSRVMQLDGFNARLQKYNDETELISRLVESGGAVFYEPRAVVQHLVGRERLNLGWQIKRHYQEGKSLADVTELQHHLPRTRRMNEIGQKLLTIAKRSARLVVSRASIQDRVHRLAHLSLLVGETVCLTKSLRVK